jgi:hypothetical protein
VGQILGLSLAPEGCVQPFGQDFSCEQEIPIMQGTLSNDCFTLTFISQRETDIASLLVKDNISSREILIQTARDALQAALIVFLGESEIDFDPSTISLAESILPTDAAMRFLP